MPVLKFTMSFGGSRMNIRIGYSESYKWLKADSVIHKTKIEVNRQGTKASAVSAMVVVAGCAPDFDRMKYVEVNRPFLYAIVHEKTGLSVFTGILNRL